MLKINLKEADSVIKAIEGGITPRRGIQHLLVGRNNEVQEIVKILDKITEGDSEIKFWVGDFGSGKSFMLRTIESIALQKNFAVSTVDLNPTRRFYSTDGKSKALYSEIIDNIVVQTAQNGRAINTIIEIWIEKVKNQIINNKNLKAEELDKNPQFIEKEILNLTSSFTTSSISYEFGQAIIQYYRGILKDDYEKKEKALRWLRGNIETKTEAKRELGIGKIINDDNLYEALKTFGELILDMGYSGFVVNFDELVNLYKIPQSQTREKNYEKILNIFNECKSNKARGMFINFGATKKTVYDKGRGMSSYEALKGRLGTENDDLSNLINTKKSVLLLKPLNNEEIFILLERLKDIYNVNYKTSIELDANEIRLYMEGKLNLPGADEFLTPRAVIKDYIEILDLIRQNPNENIIAIIEAKLGKMNKVEKDENNLDDEIEVF